jgi:hypothetical protein
MVLSELEECFADQYIFSICKFVPLVVEVFKKQDYSLERFVPGTTTEHQNQIQHSNRVRFISQIEKV